MTPTDKQAAVEAALEAAYLMGWQNSWTEGGGFHGVARAKDYAKHYAALLAEPRPEGVPDGWQAVIRKARDGLAAGGRSISGNDFEIEFGGMLIDSIEEGLELLAAAAPSPTPAEPDEPDCPHSAFDACGCYSKPAPAEQLTREAERLGMYDDPPTPAPTGDEASPDPVAVKEAYEKWPDPHSPIEGYCRFGFLLGARWQKARPNASAEPRGLKLPERIRQWSIDEHSKGYAAGWNDCLDAITHADEGKKG